MSPTQQLNAPRIIQQQQQYQAQPPMAMSAGTRIIPISMDVGAEQSGNRGPISKTPIVMQK